MNQTVLVERNVTFVIYQSCFWCASEVAGSNDRCPICNNTVYRMKLNIGKASESIKRMS